MNSYKRKGGRWCSAPNCRNNSNTNKEISFFSFPKDETRAKKWTVYCGRADLLKKDAKYLNKNCGICSVHFEDVMFANFLKNRLKPDAVPTLFSIPNPPKAISFKRKGPKERTSEISQEPKKAKFELEVDFRNIITTCQKMDHKIEKKKGPWCHSDTLTEIKSEPEEDSLASYSVYSDMDNQIKIKEEPDGLRFEELLVMPQTASCEGGEQSEKSFLLGEDCRTDFKIEIKEEPWWLDRSSTDVDEIKEAEETFILDSMANRSCSFGDNATRRQSTESDCNRNGTFENSVNNASEIPYGTRPHKGTTVKNNIDVSAAKSSKTPNNSGIAKKSSISTSALKKQHKLNHQTESRYLCEICQKSFVALSNLKLHQVIHEIEREFTCEICKMSFKLIGQLQRHLTAHTGQEESYRCEICEKSCRSLYQLKRHASIYKGKCKLRCEICAKTFKRLSNLRDHKLIHEGKAKFKCEFCEKAFNYLSNLRQHKVTHEDKSKFQCEICQKTFSRLSRLRGHKLIHEGKTPYKCEICKKCFVEFSSLKRHKLIHEGNKNFKV